MVRGTLALSTQIKYKSHDTLWHHLPSFYTYKGPVPDVYKKMRSHGTIISWEYYAMKMIKSIEEIEK